MATRSFALLAGFLYLSLGIFSFFPGLNQLPPSDAPRLAIEHSYGYLFGLFPVNIIHNLAYLGIGVWGFVASKRIDASRMFTRSTSVIFSVLTVMGLLPGLNTIFGFMPLFGHNVWLHAVTALVAAYVGFAAPAEVTRVRRTDVKSDRVKVYEEHLQQ